MASAPAPGWPAAPGEPQSPMGELVAEALAEGYSKPKADGSPQPYHGYVYRMLTAQGPYAPGGARSYLAGGQLTGGFAVLAYPVEYGNSGVMSFLVNENGIVYESDLGLETTERARAMTSYDPDPGWNVCR